MRLESRFPLFSLVQLGFAALRPSACSPLDAGLGLAHRGALLP